MALEISINEKYKDVLVHSNELQMIIDQIQVLLFTIPGEILGEPNFGIDLKRYLFELRFSAQDMNTYIKSQINTHVKFVYKFPIDVNVRLFQGDFENSAFIDIMINDYPVMGIHITK